ncbi:MAG: hypothetical protein ABIJ96_02100 [Elusimicrobiota bacterium]
MTDMPKKAGACEKIKVFAKTRRFWALLLAAPVTVLVLPAALISLKSPAMLLTSFSSGEVLIAGLLFAGGSALTAVLVLAWTWIVSGRVPEIRERRRRRFFFGLLCLGNLVLYYFAVLRFTVGGWATGALLAAAAVCLSGGLRRLARAAGSS